MKRLVVGSAVAVVVALLVSGSAPVTRAQEAMPWMRVDIMEVIPDQLDEFIETQLEQVNPALRRAGVPWRSAWRTAEFGNLYERMFVTPMDDLAELDRGGPLAFALDRRDLERIDERVRRTISGHRSYALRYRPELSVESPNAGGLALAWAIGPVYRPQPHPTLVGVFQLRDGNPFSSGWWLASLYAIAYVALVVALVTLVN